MPKWGLVSMLAIVAVLEWVSTGRPVTEMQMLISVVIYFGWSIESKLDKR
jgi:hypothetical protein